MGALTTTPWCLVTNRYWNQRPDRLWVPPNLLSNGYRVFPWWYSSRGIKLTTHLHLLLRLRMHGAIPPLPCTYLWRGAELNTRLTLPFSHACCMQPRFDNCNICWRLQVMKIHIIQFCSPCCYFRHLCCRYSDRRRSCKIGIWFSWHWTLYLRNNICTCKSSGKTLVLNDNAKES
jgi:hypothetical protein